MTPTESQDLPPPPQSAAHAASCSARRPAAHATRNHSGAGTGNCPRRGVAGCWRGGTPGVRAPRRGHARVKRARPRPGCWWRPNPPMKQPICHLRIPCAEGAAQHPARRARVRLLARGGSACTSACRQHYGLARRISARCSECI